MNLRATDHSGGDEIIRGNSYSVCLNGPADDAGSLRGYWEGLCAGGEVLLPLTRAGWGDEYGMCADRFGVTWRVTIEA
jgi:PhnB protein